MNERRRQRCVSATDALGKRRAPLSLIAVVLWCVAGTVQCWKTNVVPSTRRHHRNNPATIGSWRRFVPLPLQSIRQQQRRTNHYDYHHRTAGSGENTWISSDRHIQQRRLSHSVRTAGVVDRVGALRAGGDDVRVSDVVNDQNEEQQPPRKDRSVVLMTATSLLTACIAAAATGVLPGYTSGTAIFNVDWLLLGRDVGSTLLTAVLGYAFVQIVSYGVRLGRVEPRDARKIIHTLSAPLFMVFWPLFTALPSARFFAAIVPAINAVRLYLASGSGSSTSSESSDATNAEADLAAAVSRSGDAKEAIGGPFIYVCVLAAGILFFWRDSAVAIVALSTMAAGDGMADLMGRRFGRTNQWPNTNKSVAGTLAFWLSSTVTATSLLVWMHYTGCLTLPFALPELVQTVAGITLVSAILEIVPWFGDDNYTVPLSAAMLTILLWH